MAQDSAPRPPPIRVAVVDDFKLVTEGVAAHLASPRFGISVVIQATSWAELLQHPQFPAAVTVLDLGLGDGIHISTKIQALRNAGSEVVVMSRHTDAASVSRAILAGALGFVPKTDGTAQLVKAITSAAAGHHYLDEPLASAVHKLGTSTNPDLGRREHNAIALYATGRSVREVAAEMQTTDETVKSYIKRARRKYREAGIELGTRALLRQHGIREGWLEPD